MRKVREAVRETVPVFKHPVTIPLMNTMSHDSPPPFHHRPTYAEVKLGALQQNLQTIRSFAAPAKVMAVVKANAYGHGLLQCSRALEQVGADAFGVAYIEEAIELRRGGISAPILVFGGLLQDQLHLYMENDVDVTASSVSKLEQISETARRFGKRARVHLKIDTGMERIGVHYYSARPLFDAALAAAHIDVVGVYSHFANADSADQGFTKVQLERYLEAVEYFRKRAQGPFMRHIAGSGGIVGVPESHLDMVRPGFILYGGYPDPGYKTTIVLEPVLSLKSQVVYFKVVKKGAGVSYGHRWVAPEDTRVVTVPIGYGDGYYRNFSNRSSVLIRGVRYPVVGAVCMDQLMVNIGQGTAYNGDEVVLLGEQGGERITLEDLNEFTAGNARELLVLLNQRVPRVYV